MEEGKTKSSSKTRPDSPRPEGSPPSQKVSVPTKTLKCIHEGCEAFIVAREDEKAQFLCPEHSDDDSARWELQGEYKIGGFMVSVPKVVVSPDAKAARDLADLIGIQHKHGAILGWSYGEAVRIIHEQLKAVRTECTVEIDRLKNELKMALEAVEAFEMPSPVKKIIDDAVVTEIKLLRSGLQRARKWADEDGTVSIISMIDRVLNGGPLDLEKLDD